MELPGLFPWRARARTGVLAFSLADNSLRYVYATQANERRATIAAWGTETRGNQSREAFMRRLRTAVPSAERAVMVLDPDNYQIMQVEAPNVPPEELRGAIRWRAAEFLEGSPHDYTLDVLGMAAAGEATGKVIAIAAHNDFLRVRMQECESLGIPLAVIDVAETAQRNLLHAALVAEAGAPNVAGALVADAGRASMVIAVNGQLGFFRRFEFNTDLLAVPADEAQPDMMSQGVVAETAARSMSQLERSLDLWENTYPHLPVQTLRVYAGAKTDVIVARIAAEAGVDTRPLAVAGAFGLSGSKSNPPWNDAAYLPLLGALLRPVEVRP